MMRSSKRIIGALLMTAALSAASQSQPQKLSQPEKVSLNNDWYIQSSTAVRQSGQELSRPTFQPRGWYPARVPSSVLAALVADRIYPDPYFGMNLRSIPGTTYPIGANFSNIQMPPGSPFASSWWYQTKFTIPTSYQSKQIHLHFDGINFRSNVWLNGQQIATSQQLAGSWRLFELDVTNSAVVDGPNALAVEVFPPTPEDLAITFVDWNPAPPDKGMGLWRNVYLTASGPVTIRFPQVVTKLNLPDTNEARLTVSAELTNASTTAVSGVLHGRIEAIAFSQPVQLTPGGHQIVTFSPEAFHQLIVKSPRLWWPAQIGPQNLYELNLRFETNGVVSDVATSNFGIREISSTLEPAPPATGRPTSDDDQPLRTSRLFRINGKNILIRGAGFSFDMLLRESPERQEQQLQYVRDLNLNTVRLEGKLVDDHFLDLADKYGILITAGWCCCDHWEQWKRWDDEDRLIAAESLKDQIRRLRSHPSVFNWMNGSDNPPPPDVEKMYVEILKQLNWPNPYESSATARPTSVTGETGVKMTGPYDYVPPNYWLLDQRLGGAHGFNTETSPGAAVPPVDSLRDMLGSDHLWPVDSWWDFHAGGGVFRNIQTFQSALNKRYGLASNVEQFAIESQAMEYEGERAMFEAYGRNKYRSTGVIQWMLNNAWPSIIWHLYDYYLRPGGGYFGVKKACEPLHVQYSYDDSSVAVVNSYYSDFEGLKVAARLLNLDLSEKFAKQMRINVPSDGVQKAFAIPPIDGLSSTYFLQLTLEDSSGKLVSSNFYWLSTKPDTLDWKHSTWYYTPLLSTADFTALHNLPNIDLAVSAVSKKQNDSELTTVTIQNPARTLAFLIHVKVMKTVRDPEEDDAAHVAEVLPVLWTDNYITVLPGETRTLTAAYKAGSERERSLVVVDGWNIQPKSVRASAQ